MVQRWVQLTDYPNSREARDQDPLGLTPRSLKCSHMYSCLPSRLCPLPSSSSSSLRQTAMIRGTHSTVNTWTFTMDLVSSSPSYLNSFIYVIKYILKVFRVLRFSIHYANKVGATCNAYSILHGGHRCNYCCRPFYELCIIIFHQTIRKIN